MVKNTHSQIGVHRAAEAIQYTSDLQPAVELAEQPLVQQQFRNSGEHGIWGRLSQ